MNSMKKAKQVRIKSIVIHYNENGIFGIKTVYDADGKEVTQSHQNKSQKGELLKEKIILEEDE